MINNMSSCLILQVSVLQDLSTQVQLQPIPQAIATEASNGESSSEDEDSSNDISPDNTYYVLGVSHLSEEQSDADENDRNPTVDTTDILSELKDIQWSYKPVTKGYSIKTSPPIYNGEEGIKSGLTFDTVLECIDTICGLSYGQAHHMNNYARSKVLLKSSR